MDWRFWVGRRLRKQRMSVETCSRLDQMSSVTRVEECQRGSQLLGGWESIDSQIADAGERQISVWERLRRMIKYLT